MSSTIPFTVQGGSGSTLTSSSLPNVLRQVVGQSVPSWSYQMPVLIHPPAPPILTEQSVPDFGWHPLPLTSAREAYGNAPFFPYSGPLAAEGYVHSTLPDIAKHWTVRVYSASNELLHTANVTLNISGLRFYVLYVLQAYDNNPYDSLQAYSQFIYAETLNGVDSRPPSPYLADGGAATAAAIGDFTPSPDIPGNAAGYQMRIPFTDGGLGENLSYVPGSVSSWPGTYGPPIWTPNQVYTPNPPIAGNPFWYDDSGTLSPYTGATDADLDAFLANVDALSLYNQRIALSQSALPVKIGPETRAGVRITYTSPSFNFPLEAGQIIEWEWDEDLESTEIAKARVFCGLQFSSVASVGAIHIDGAISLRYTQYYASYLSPPFTRYAPLLYAPDLVFRERFLVRPSGKIKLRPSSVLWQHRGEARFWAAETSTADIYATDDEGATWNLMSNAWADVENALAIDFVSLPFKAAISIARVGSDLQSRYSPDGINWQTPQTICPYGSGSWVIGSHEHAGDDRVTVRDMKGTARFDTINRGTTWQEIS